MTFQDQIICGDCIDVMGGMDAASAPLVFADPPFNIGLRYDQYKDRLSYEAYYQWSSEWVAQAYRVLSANGSIYVAMGDEFAAELNIILKRAGFIFRNWITWHYAFGENQKMKFSRCKTHILYFTKSMDVTFNQQDILVPSARQLIYGDKRAKAGGKTPDDVWPVYADAGGAAHELAVWPQDWEVWRDSRVCGTFKERLIKPDGSAHPCQMPLSILRRIIRASSNVGDMVLDPFSGTGTTAAAAVELGRRFCAIDVSLEYCALGAERLFGDRHRFLEGAVNTVAA
jgi:DNA modification methylase